MRKFQFTQLVKTGAAFGLVSTITVDSWVLFADIAAYDIPPEYYALAPLAVIGLGGIPATIALASRLADEAYKSPSRFGPSPLKSSTASPVISLGAETD